MGWIREADAGDRYRLLASDYVESVEAGKTALVVCPTHREGARVTAAVREKLKSLGHIHGEEQLVSQLTNLNLTEAERSDPRFLEPGDVLVFHQNARGHSKGDRVPVNGQPLPLDQASRYQVFRPSTLPLATGDTVRITRGGKTQDGQHALNNGAIYELAGFDDHGNRGMTESCGS